MFDHHNRVHEVAEDAWSFCTMPSPIQLCMGSSRGVSNVLHTSHALSPPPS